MAHPVDLHVGKVIRQRRWLAGMTQQKLAQEIGVKFQQVQKYETGANRVSSSRLWEIAGALGVTVSEFFEGLPRENDVPANLSNSEGEAANFLPQSIMESKEVTELVRAYYSIPEDKRRRLYDLANVMSA